LFYFYYFLGTTDSMPRNESLTSAVIVEHESQDAKADDCGNGRLFRLVDLFVSQSPAKRLWDLIGMEQTLFYASRSTNGRRTRYEMIAGCAESQRWSLVAGHAVRLSADQSLHSGALL
jgi:hypothetical protein